MKGIVAEICNSHMIVITKDGEFVKCKKLPCFNIGDEVNIPKASLSSMYKKISAVAASFLIFAMLSSGVYAYYTPYSYVSVDINPSLELYVNRFDKVIGVHAFNEDAEILLETAKNIKNKEVEAALTDILNSAADKGYLKEETENNLMIVVSSSNLKEQKVLTEKVSKVSTGILSMVSNDYELILENTEVGAYKQAQKQNISPGKVILAQQLKESMPEINEDQIKKMSLRQAINQIEENIKNKKEQQNKENQVKPEQKTITTETPSTKKTAKGNVKNVKELVKEKNEEQSKNSGVKASTTDKTKGEDKTKQGFQDSNKKDAINRSSNTQQPVDDDGNKEELKGNSKENKVNNNQNKNPNKK